MVRTNRLINGRAFRADRKLNRVTANERRIYGNGKDQPALVADSESEPGGTTLASELKPARESLPDTLRPMSYINWEMGVSLSMKPRSILAAFLLAFTASIIDAAAQTPPPAPVLVAPANGASLVQPIGLQWQAVSDPDGPIGSYVWQVGTSSGFTNIIASGFKDSRHGTPIPTQDRLSGLPNGTYFWRVRATQEVGGAVGFIESAWSTVRSFTVTGLGAAPAGTPSFTSPGNGSRFHAWETFKINWTAVPGAQYYVLEADDEPSFSFPLDAQPEPDGVRHQLPRRLGQRDPEHLLPRSRGLGRQRARPAVGDAERQDHQRRAGAAGADAASPSGGATVSLPFTFDWTDTVNPQIPGYDIDVDDEPTFSGTFGVLLVQNVARSDYTVMSDSNLAPGNYYWRVRAVHGLVRGPWSAGVNFRVVAPPPTPAGLNLFTFQAQPSSVSGGNSTQARVSLNGPAPAGGAVVTVASDLPHAEVPRTVVIPEGKTTAMVSPITTIPVSAAVVGTLRATYGGTWQLSSLGLWPLLFSLSLNQESVVGGTSVTGTVTLLQAAPAGGAVVTLVSTDTALVRPPASVFVPEGATAVSFAIATSAVAENQLVTINTGTGNDNYRAPEVRDQCCGRPERHRRRRACPR